MSIRNTNSAIVHQDVCWAKHLGIKLIKPRRQLDRLRKVLVEKSINSYIQDKICSSCLKYVQILDVTNEQLKYWTKSGICSRCQLKLIKNNSE